MGTTPVGTNGLTTLDGNTSVAVVTDIQSVVVSVDTAITGAKNQATNGDTSTLSSAKAYTDGEVAADRGRLTSIESKNTAQDTTLNAIVARELPDRGAISGTTHPGGIDTVTTSGKYSIWSTTAAQALGMPSSAVAGTVAVFSFGNVVEQFYNRHLSGGVETVGRRKAGTTWSPWTSTGVSDSGVAGLITSGTQTYTKIAAMIPNAGTKIAAVSLTTGDGGGLDTATSRSFRVPFKLGARVNRWRVHIQNLNPRYGNRYAGALSFTGLGYSVHAGATNQSLEGQPAGAVTSIAEGFTTNASGFEYVSPWVEADLEPNQEYLLHGGYTCAAQNNFAGAGGGWVTGSATDWNTTNPAGLTITKSAPLYLWLEVEVSAGTPVVAYFGDSLSSGVSARLPVFDSFPNRHALANGHIPTLYASSGVTMNDHSDPAHFRWARYDTAAPAKPDAVVWAMGSNDVFGAGVTVETMQARFDTCWNILASKLSPKIALMTILPRHDGGHAQEPVRKAWNEHLLTTLPGRALVAVDSAAALTNPDGSTLNQKYSATSTDIHLTAAGYARYQLGLPPMHG